MNLEKSTPSIKSLGKNAVETTIEYKGKELVLNNLKLGKRDSKGTKVRV